MNYTLSVQEDSTTLIRSFLDWQYSKPFKNMIVSLVCFYIQLFLFNYLNGIFGTSQTNFIRTVPRLK